MDSMHPVRFVSLTKNPRTTTEAESTANAIRKALAGDTVAMEGIGTMHSLKQGRLLEQRSWAQAVFINQQLAEDYFEHIQGNPELVRLGDVADIGPAPQRLSDTFTINKGASLTGAEFHCLKDHKTDREVTMMTSPTATMKAMRGRSDYAKHLWSMRSHMLLPTRFQPNTVKVMATWSGKPTLSTAFTPCRPHGDDPARTMKAYIAFLNSSAGILQFLATRSRKLTYPKYSLDSLRELRVPKDGIEALATVFDEVNTDKLMSIDNLVDDIIRQRLDRAVEKVVPTLGKSIDRWSREISVEPTVHCRTKEQQTNSLLRLSKTARK